MYNNEPNQDDRDIVELRDYESYKKLQAYESKSVMSENSNASSLQEHEKQHSFGEELIHQGIETIEFVLG